MKGDFIMDIMDQLQKLFDTALIPAIIGAIMYILTLIKKCVKKYLKQLEIKQELDNMAKMQEIKNKLLVEIKTIVDSTVGSTMQIADAMKKENGGFLTDNQSIDIKNNVTEIIFASLPCSLTEEDGVLLDVIGGWDRLNTIVASMIDRSVYDYKIKRMRSNS